CIPLCQTFDYFVYVCVQNFSSPRLLVGQHAILYLDEISFLFSVLLTIHLQPRYQTLARKLPIIIILRHHSSRFPTFGASAGTPIDGLRLGLHSNSTKQQQQQQHRRPIPIASPLRVLSNPHIPPDSIPEPSPIYHL